MTDIGDTLGGFVGPIIGIGLGLYTLKLLNQLPTHQRQDVERLLSYSEPLGAGGKSVVWVKSYNLTQAKKLLFKSGFKVFDVTRYGDKYQVVFREKRK